MHVTISMYRKCKNDGVENRGEPGQQKATTLSYYILYLNDICTHIHKTHVYTYI